jgi:hypothetical protein
MSYLRKQVKKMSIAMQSDQNASAGGNLYGYLTVSQGYRYLGMDIMTIVLGTLGIGTAPISRLVRSQTSQ